MLSNADLDSHDDIDGTCSQIVSGLLGSADVRIRGVQPFHDLRRVNNIDFFFVYRYAKFFILRRNNKW